MRGEGINLQKVANGWVVILPQSQAPYSMMMGGPEIDFSNPRNIKRMARIMKEEMAKDPLLEDIHNANEGIEPEPDEFVTRPVMPEPSIKQDNVFIFSTFDDASAFIKSKYDN